MSVSPAARVHPSAVVEPGAHVGAGCEIGPFCHVGPEVVLGAGVRLMSHVVVSGATGIGEGTEIHPFAVIGGSPQDKKYGGEPSRLIVGRRNRIREHVTMNSGTAAGTGATVVGDDGLFMAGCHVAHDVRIGDRVVLVNHASVGGHCDIGDDVILGGLTGVHQWVRIGQGSIVGAVTMVTHDVIPYSLVQAPRGTIDGLNLVGLKRQGVARSDITALRAAFQTLAQGEGTFQDRARRLGEDTDSDYVRRIVAFVTNGAGRSFLTPGDR
ncbi:acyl-ACP--UDP-N- acetylglucosamine O-acyltransferase [Oceanicola sp. 22II-s10i]|uniref:acyl-ACP--UDP-N-acetylglucosamine O-acyltransferase n=1 Tax=Oceanicola sp. 22II-s10i TaxID=1317116 RepID=UPI000B524E36|nr:acyl-ACP--UDP-N-acetylglucosamine O-acyltransferase [Oceanicola sp. 22II-s10i]OWU83580.1 acyl-ACP--UDP-N- acetylglucosamine O-acyltransferase [Oceanicola sp. 22II-s10i]